ncbi:DUF6625 family protein [uncultured Desulfobacter sp.]|uniref:DUF6625 family protein n=1 Tax=uncultured Desulfobacter sp. TaxID=240139 RepID=UPI002AAA9221|nr:DUF6625 family protein [uncultured Desulfobacter sp.]
MLDLQLKSAFLVPFFGELPVYFPFWAKSCELNHPNFHWFVYNDRITESKALNPAVTLIPYKFGEMVADFKQRLDINIPGRSLRRVCDYRLMFYFLRNGKEDLDCYDFIGFTDMDLVYGRLLGCMPEKMECYSMISADNDRPCGPFTLIKRLEMHSLKEYQYIKKHMEPQEHRAFDESKELMQVVSGNLPPYCRADLLQPTMTKGVSNTKVYAIWEKGKVTIYDIYCNRLEAGFFHFSRYKDKKRFVIDTDALRRDRWGIYKFGITRLASRWHRTKMNLSLLI